MLSICLIVSHSFGSNLSFTILTNKNDLKYAVNELNIEYSNQLKKRYKETFSFYINQKVYNDISLILKDVEFNKISFTSFINKLISNNE